MSEDTQTDRKKSDLGGNHEIESVGHGERGRYYDLADDAPLEGVTTNELDGTVTLHEVDSNIAGKDDLPDDVERVLRDFVAVARDTDLGYPPGELHRNPTDLIEEALELLVNYGHQPGNLVEEDQAAIIGVNLPDTDEHD